jgi:hypothetical protein
MLSKKIIWKYNLLNSTICQELFNMGIIWKFQMTHCLIKNMYANKLFEIGIIFYFLYVMFFLGARHSCVYLSVYLSVVIHAYEFYVFVEYLNCFVTWFPIFVWSHMWVWIWSRLDILVEFIYIWCTINNHV